MSWRKPRREIRVPGLVGEMGEKGAARSDGLCGLDRLRDAQVRGVRPPPERVDHQDVEAAQALSLGLGYGLHIGDVRQAAEPIAEDPKMTVLKGERQDVRACHANQAAGLPACISRLGFDVPS